MQDILKRILANSKEREVLIHTYTYTVGEALQKIEVGSRKSRWAKQKITGNSHLLP